MTQDTKMTHAASVGSVMDSSSSGDMRVPLAGVDSVYFSCDLPISGAMRETLEIEKRIAQRVAREQRGAHCPEWLGAQVCPHGAQGGYAFLIETEDFSVKLLGERIQNRPGVYIEMRAYALHTHPRGPQGACEDALAWVRVRLFSDQSPALVKSVISFAAAKLSRADIHIDWQGGYAPTLHNVSEEIRAFIRPGKTKGALYFQGSRPTGYTFGKGHVQARLYNKSLETREKANEWYGELLQARCGEAFDPTRDVWRLEFQLRREGVKGFKLYAPSEEEDDEAEIEAELAAEELQHIGTLPRFFARMHELFAYLTAHWLRLVEDNGSANRSRWPLHPTWQALREQFAQVARGAQNWQREPLSHEQGDEQTPAQQQEREEQQEKEDKRILVRGAKYSGKNRVLRRLALGVVKSLEVEDASPTSAALLALEGWVERLAEKEVERITRRCAHYEESGRAVPRWVRRGMGERFARVRQVEHRVQMLLGVLSAKGVLPLEFKPASSVGDLLVQHLGELEAEAERKGGVEQVLADHFAKVYKVRLPHLPVMGRAA